MTQAMRFNVDASDNASAVFRKVAAAAEKLKETLKDLDKRITPTVRLEGAPEVKRDIAAIRRDMDRIRNVDAKVKVSVAGNAALNNLTQKLDRISDASVVVTVTIQPPGVETRLRALNSLLRSLQGRTEHTVEVKEKGADSTRNRLGGLLKGLTGTKGLAAFTTSLIAVGGAASAAAASVGGLVAAAATLGGAFVATGPILLAGAGMIGGVLATIKVGTQGLSQAFEALAEGDMKAWGKALANLSPEAQKFAIAIKDVWGALRQAKGAVQDNLFQGMAEAVSNLARVELPVLKQGMGAVAAELNLAAKAVLDYIGSTDGIDRQRSMWESTATVVQNLRPWLTNVTAAMFDIGEVGGRVLADITGGAGQAGAGFRQMIADARQSGELEQIMRRGVDVLRQLGSIAGNVGSILGSVFKAAQTAGSDFLTTLERGTAALADFLSAGAGQTALVDFFRESRATLDALGAGLVAAAGAAARFVSAFSNTGGLSAVGTALSALMIAVAPLAETLGRLAGESLRLLAESATNLAAALTPIATVISGVVSAMGPLAPAIVASVIAFAGLRAASAGIAAMGVAASGAALKVGVYSTALTGSVAAGTRAATAATVVGAAMRGLSLAIPIIGVALVAVTALFGAFGAAATASAEDVANGSATMQQAVAAELASIQQRDAAYAGMQGEGYAVGQAIGEMTGKIDTNAQSMAQEAEAVANVEAAYQAYRATLSPFAQLQADVTRAQGELNDAIASGDTAAASAAADRLAQADGRLKSAQDQAADAAKTHADAVNELSDAMQSQIGSALAYEEAVKRTADAHKAANDALKEGGAESEKYTTAVLDLAQAQEQQAQSAQRRVEAQLANESADVRATAGLQAYNLELLKVNDGSAAGQAAFFKLASGLDQTGLDALSATAKMSGLKTEVLTLPDGRTVTVVTAADTAQLDAAKIALEQITRQKWQGTVTFVGDPTRVNGQLQQTVQFINGQRGVISFDGNNQPVLLTLGNTKYAIDATTGALKILGDAAPGEADLSGFKLKIDQTTGAVTFEAVTAPVDAARTDAQQPVDAPVNLQPNAAPVDAAKTDAAAPVQTPVNLDPVPGLVPGAKAEAATPVQTPVNLEPNAGTVPGAKADAAAPVTTPVTFTVDASQVTSAKATAASPTSSVHTITVTDNVPAAKAAASQPSTSMHTINADDKAVVDAKSRAVQATSSMHTINCNDSAVVDAKRRAQQATSSTHTIHVVVVGAPVPRAIGAYATPRAQGAYAAYANGGLRPMSAARAQIVPPRQPRVIGDRMKGDEAFIPVNQSPLSQAILNTTAQRMGYNLVPQNGQAMPASGAPASVSLSSIRSAINQRAAGGGGALVSAVQQLSGQLRALRGDVDHHSDNAAIVQELRAVRSLLAQGGGSGSATARAQTSRTVAELGAF